MKLYLVQRGHLHPGVNFDKFTGINDNCFVKLDYMGAAEFEYGAISYAYRRFFDKFKEFELVKTDLVTLNGAYFYLYCKKDHYEETLACIKEYIDNPYKLHEYSHLAEYFNPNKAKHAWNDSYKKTDFWWDIRNDWIGFIAGGEKCDKEKANDEIGKANSFISIICRDFQNLWQNRTEEEREEMRKEIYQYY